MHKGTAERIVESVRRDMVAGRLRPGDQLPTVRKMAVKWSCAPGTVQAAYRELNQLGLTTSKVGWGTYVRGDVSQTLENDKPLRRAELVNRMETYLLDVLSSGYTPGEVESAMKVALDRWRAIINTPPRRAAHILRFVGSHEPGVSMVASHFPEIDATTELNVVFAGSTAGLEALAEGRAEVAGCHLFDLETRTYNEPFVRRLLPGRKIALVRLLERELCLVTRWGDMDRIRTLADLTQYGVRFINRQRGSGTRIWLDIQLDALGIRRIDIKGYEMEVATHGEVLQAIAEGRADAGLAIHPAALDYDLNGRRLAWQPYDLVVTSETWELPAFQALEQWLLMPDTHELLGGVMGYDARKSGYVQKIRT